MRWAISSEAVTFLRGCIRGIPHARTIVVLTIGMGIAAGLSNTLLLALITETINREGSSLQPRWILGFAGLFLLLPATRFGAQFLLSALTTRLGFQMRVNLGSSILRAPLRRLEQLGAARLLAAFTNDVGAVTALLANIPGLVMNLALVAGCLCYLAWLSPTVLVWVLVLMVVGSVSYRIPLTRAMVYLRESRERFDALLEHFRAVTDGTKELKLHQRRRLAFRSELLEETADALRAASFKGQTVYAAARSWGQALFFFTVGLLLFLVPNLPGGEGIDRYVLTGYIFTILYMMTSIEALISTFPILGAASVAVDKLESLELEMDSAGSEAEVPALAPAGWQRLELSRVTHTYLCQESEDSFTLGPIDLVFEPGEVVFLVGGNGSGKTTLSKLLTGLYLPDSGEVRLDGETVTEEKVESYRQLFTAVFSDFFLFQRLLGIDAGTVDDHALDYLAELRLDRKVKIEEGAFSTLQLSDGQRKRLALLTAYLEDRPIYVFDEWAANQDPVFKEVFYDRILAELKARGKLVVVSSHDDRYFGVGDRVITLEYGRVRSDERIPHEAVPAAAPP